MMSSAAADNPAHVQQVKLITSGDRFWDVSDETFQRAAATQNTNQHVARINLRQTPRRQFEHVVSGAVRERAHHHDIARAHFAPLTHNRNSSVQPKRRSGRPNLVSLNHSYGAGN